MGLNAPSIAIELTAIGRQVVAIANCTIGNFGENFEMSIYIRI